MRIGIVGAESSHTAELLRLVNEEGRTPGVRVVAVAPVDLTGPAGTDPALWVDGPQDLIGAVDAALVLTRDGATHRALAEPLLRAGLPVWVDKPFATVVDDARAMITTARSAGSLVWSRSALRFTAGVRRAAELAAQGEVLHLHLVGPADPNGPYSGIAFYGIHLLEAAVEVLGPAGWSEARVAVQVGGRGVVATTRLAGIPVTCTFVPAGGGFQLIAVTARGVRTEVLDLGRDYLLAPAEGFLAACAGRVPAQP
ncbi:MAG: Gfo/Idh/MocA family oxidoreductase, partial [Pseudonocardia sp.]